ncbi:MAG: nuclear transport factor 2 family protein [Akkermansiaceae bacterium]
MRPSDINELITAAEEANMRWKEAFNAGDAKRCAFLYEKSATMRAEPFGIFKGRDAIQAFWQTLIDQGFSDVEYMEPKIEVQDASTAILTTDWTMNKAYGQIHREVWALQEDGTAKFREDVFEAHE